MTWRAVPGRVTRRAAGYAALAHAGVEALTVALVIALLTVLSNRATSLVAVLALEALALATAASLVVVAAWVAEGRAGAAGATGFAAAWLAALALVVSAVAGTAGVVGPGASASTLGGLIDRATSVRFVATGGWLVSVAAGHHDARFERVQESIAGFAGVFLIVGVFLGPLRLVALVLSVAWFAWVGRWLLGEE